MPKADITIYTDLSTFQFADSNIISVYKVIKTTLMTK